MTIGRLAKPLAVAAIALYFAVRMGSGAVVATLDTPYDGNAGAAVDVRVSPGTSAAAVGALLEGAGVIRSGTALRWWMRWSGTAGDIHTGQYRFQGPHSLREVVDVVTHGRVVLDVVTVVEGATRWQVAEALSAAGFGTYEEAWDATGEGWRVADLDPDAADLEGYLFPDTYHAPRGAGARDIVEMMVARFRQVWLPARADAAAALGFTVREAITMASLVEAETGQASERTLVAGVYHNRLDRRMLLQCDPTLLYALRLDGRTDRNIRRADFTNESPYNTYRFAGLPPGPIGNPGEASIEAALGPAETDYLYFVGRNDGSHAFSRTLAEHNANVNRYQR